MQTEAPEDGANWPAAQPVMAERLMTPQKFPAGQVVQAVWPEEGL
jgi:hypothetical protein